MCSLVRELRQLKEQLALSVEEAALGGAADEEDADSALARQQLANMLVALSAHVSLLHERVHEALLSQVLGIQLWTSPQVGTHCTDCNAFWPFNAVTAWTRKWKTLHQQEACDCSVLHMCCRAASEATQLANQDDCYPVVGYLAPSADPQADSSPWCCLFPQEVRAAALQLVQHLVLCSGPLMHLALRMLVLGLSPPPRPPPPGGTASPAGGAWRPQPHAVLVQDQVIAVLLKVRPQSIDPVSQLLGSSWPAQTAGVGQSQWQLPGSPCPTHPHGWHEGERLPVWCLCTVLHSAQGCQMLHMHCLHTRQTGQLCTSIPWCCLVACLIPQKSH